MRYLTAGVLSTGRSPSSRRPSMGELAYRDSASPARRSQREAQEGRQASSHPSQVKGREAMQPDVRPSSLEALSLSDSHGWCRRGSPSFSPGCAGVQKLVRGARLTAPRFACHALSRQPRAPETSSWLRQVANKPDDTMHKCNCRRCTNVVDVGQPGVAAPVAQVAQTDVAPAFNALAHKLARASYFMLRDQTAYDPTRLFR